MSTPPAGGGENHRPSGRRIDGNGKVELAFDFESLFDQDRLDRVSSDGHEGDLGCRRRYLGSIVDDPNTASLASSAHRNLRLDDDARLVVELGFAPRYGYPSLGQHRLGLVLEEHHRP